MTWVSVKPKLIDAVRQSSNENLSQIFLHCQILYGTLSNFSAIVTFMRVAARGFSGGRLKSLFTYFSMFEDYFSPSNLAYATRLSA